MDRKELREFRRQSNLCLVCGKTPPEDAKTMCRGCLEKQNAASKKSIEKHGHTRDRRVAAGLCSECGKPPNANGKMCDGCLRKAADKQAKYVAARILAGKCPCGNEKPAEAKRCERCSTDSRNKARARSASGICIRCGGIPRPNRKLCEPCSKKSEFETKRGRQSNKKKVFDHYGRVCKCCGIDVPEFLTIDHVNGGGNKQRRALGGGTAFYRWIVNNGFPDDMRTLCMNCNTAKGFFGFCPHERERQAAASQELAVT